MRANFSRLRSGNVNPGSCFQRPQAALDRAFLLLTGGAVANKRSG